MRSVCHFIAAFLMCGLIRAAEETEIPAPDRLASAAAIIENGTGADGLYPAEWHKGARDTTANFNTQVSALAALVAAMQAVR